MKNKQVASRSMRFVQAARMTPLATRAFGITKYKFSDEDWKPNQFQVSAEISLTSFIGFGRLT